MEKSPSIIKENLPPMLQQYLRYKEQYPDCLLLFQVGDFYEAFFEDAVSLSRTLNLTLTSRDKNSDNPIPMAGMPIAVVDSYLERLLAANLSVAVVSQNGSPNGRTMVERKLERIVSPGVRLLSSSAATEGNYVAAVSFSFLPGTEIQAENDYSLAYIQPETARAYIAENLDKSALLQKLSVLAPSEVIFPRQIENRQVDRRLTLIREIEKTHSNALLRFRSEESLHARSRRREYLEIPGYAPLGNSARIAVRLLLNYIDEITVDSNIPVRAIEQPGENDTVQIDANTRNSLDLLQNSKTLGKQGSLFGYLDHCQTPGGSRLLKQWISFPSANLAEIERRLNTVETLINQISFARALRKIFSLTADLERISARIELGAVQPKELAALRDSLEIGTELITLLNTLQLKTDSYLKNCQQNLKIPQELFDILKNSLSEDPPHVVKEGGIFKAGYHQELDKLISIRTEGSSWITKIETEERERSGINSLKIKYNNIQGYYIEITKANIDKVPANYVKKQSTVNSERYYTPELKKLEEDILSAEGRQLQLEKELYQQLKTQILPHCQILREYYIVVSQLDCLTALAEVSVAEVLVRPEITAATELQIVQGKHPLLAQMLKSEFISNSIDLDPSLHSCLILTGPNMGGKSTYLRQTALIVILAQIGCFVPAESAKIGLVDKIFARIGSADDLLEGESTFMVEMRQTAQIISSATDKSLILVDELGRGTATIDGLALARAVLEWLITKLKCRTLFATHFHMLTALPEIYSEAVNYSVGAADADGQVIFTHQICPGPANRSYGLEVAQMAGLPELLVSRAQALVNEIEISEQAEIKNGEQLSLFNVAAVSAESITKEDQEKLEKYSQLSRKVAELDINSITPLEALSILNSLRKDLATGN